ncbi:hypothetical protein HBE96_01480 [Clostridium sp. P21]|uniref:Uncharacterized protein n=1 Tax=Clostridium muellerianum TaxID=2716538 RepID=A0A7Y0EF80_9CLOT|nr:hypothetical protein [Clostridium muellerianum]NMM61390.1 hypothetical protein [Clostridium muellerianum]
MKRENNLNMEKGVLKAECTQKVKEYIFTELDELLYKTVTNLTDDGLKEYLNSLSGPVVTYENSYVKYNKEENCFEVVYYVNSRFCREELYEYKVKNNSIFYNCIDCIFEEGGK